MSKERKQRKMCLVSSTKSTVSVLLLHYSWLLPSVVLCVRMVMAPYLSAIDKRQFVLIIRAAGLRTGTRKKKSYHVFFFNDVVTSHHCELYHYIIILHSSEAF